MKNPIMNFVGQNSFLSNMYKVEVFCPHTKKVYPSSENAYMANKCLDNHWHDICQSITPYDAKQSSKSIPLRPDWEKIKVQIMLDVVDSKFTDTRLKDLLKQTQGSDLIEGNNWNDVFWGVSIKDKMKGANVLGQILMIVRDKREFERQWNHSNIEHGVEVLVKDPSLLKSFKSSREAFFKIKSIVKDNVTLESCSSPLQIYIHIDKLQTELLKCNMIIEKQLYEKTQELFNTTLIDTHIKSWL